MDFDGDGIVDVLTGSWPGELYFFKGQGQGKYAASEILKDKDGKKINCGSASTVYFGDCDGDGKADLLIGCVDGDVYLMKNEGTSEKHAFAAKIPIKAAGNPIKVNHGDSHPILADWNQDGKLDLMVASGDGSVAWHRNVGSKTEPQFEAGRSLLAAPPQRPGDEAVPEKAGEKQGTRAKIAVCDFNGDGVQDLLVGDFGMVQGKTPQLTPAEEKEKKTATTEFTKAQQKLEAYYNELSKLYEGINDANEAKKAEIQKKQAELEKKYEKEVKEQQTAYANFAKYQPQYEYRGYVWLLAGEANGKSK